MLSDYIDISTQSPLLMREDSDLLGGVPISSISLCTQENVDEHFGWLSVHSKKRGMKQICSKHRAARKIQNLFKSFIYNTRIRQWYVEKHYWIISNTASSIQRAQVIYLAESHSQELHRCRNAEVIQLGHRESDAILLEGLCSRMVPIRQRMTLRTQARYLEKEVLLSGWDYFTPERKKVYKDIYILSYVLTSLEQSVFSPQSDPVVKKQKIDQATTHLNSITQGVPFTDLGRKDFIEKISSSSHIVQRCCFKALFFLGFQTVMEHFYKMIKDNFALRQEVLTSTVSLELDRSKNRYRKIYLIAGKSHLVDKNGMIETNLADSLNEQKYAILLHKDDPISREEQQKIDKYLKIKCDTPGLSLYPPFLEEEVQRGFYGKGGQRDRMHEFLIKNGEEIGFGLFYLQYIN